MELLSDPLRDRAIKSIRPPPHRPLDHNLMFPLNLNGKPDWKLVRDHLHKEGRITKEDITQLVQSVNKILRNEGNLLYLEDPLTIIGDIHGQFYDAVKILDIAGNLDDTRYLFLGDFVDRGSFSIEVLVLLYSIKICYPNTVYFLRGNHECRQMTSFFNFRAECLYKYDQEVYELFMDSFDLLPLACVVNGKFLALHGGISPDLRTLDDINAVDRFKEPPKQGLFCDLLWADPVDNEHGNCEDTFKNNDVRGCSYFYGGEAVHNFLANNNLLSLIRAHEAQVDGYKMHDWEGNFGFPSVITVFSAPNYCDVYNNKGAVIKFQNNTLNIQQFNYSAHPYMLPNFMDIFTWSIPFVSEKITEMLYNIIKPEENADDEDDDESMDINIPALTRTISEDSPQSVSKLKKRSEILRSKVKFISKMVIMNKTLREQNETIVKIKTIAPDNKIPTGLLLQGESALNNVLQTFNNAREADLLNEKRPTNADSP